MARSVVQPIVHQPRRSTITSPAKCSTKRGRRQHRQELRQARANRKADQNGISRPARSVVQPSSAFFFAPPTAPALTVYPATSGVFVFGAEARLLRGLQGLDRNFQRSEDATQSALLESATQIDPVAGQSPSLSLTARINSQRPRQLHDVSPHVSLLHTSDLSALDGQFGGRLRTRRISCLNNSDVDYSPFLLACQAVRLATTPGPEGTRLQVQEPASEAEGDSTWAVGTPFRQRDCSD